MADDLKDDGARLVALAQDTRRAARGYRHMVARYCQEMPDHLDRFHQAMREFRATARRLAGDDGAGRRPREAGARRPRARGDE